MRDGLDPPLFRDSARRKAPPEAEPAAGGKMSGFLPAVGAAGGQIRRRREFFKVSGSRFCDSLCEIEHLTEDFSLAKTQKSSVLGTKGSQIEAERWV